MITAEDILTSGGTHPDRMLDPECTQAVKDNAAELAKRVDKLFDALGYPAPKITSGFRTIKANYQAGGAPHSNHLTGSAVDLQDPDNSLDTTLSLHPNLLDVCDLYRESSVHTPGWVHLQIVRPPSGNRTFNP